MKTLLGFVFALGAMFATVPASATMLYALGGTFSGKLTTHLSTTPVTRNFHDLDLAFIGLSDGSAATLSNVGGVDIYSFSLAVLAIIDDTGEIDLTGFSFLVAPSVSLSGGAPVSLVGFSGPQGLLFSVALPDAFDGTSDYAPTDFSDVVASQALTFGNRKIKLNHVDGANGTFLAFDVPVPESATWAMFIFGFGAVGAGLRRRRMPAAIAA